MSAHCDRCGADLDPITLKCDYCIVSDLCDERGKVIDSMRAELERLRDRSRVQSNRYGKAQADIGSLQREVDRLQAMPVQLDGNEVQVRDIPP